MLAFALHPFVPAWEQMCTATSLGLCWTALNGPPATPNVSDSSTLTSNTAASSALWSCQPGGCKSSMELPRRLKIRFLRQCLIRTLLADVWWHALHAWKTCCVPVWFGTHIFLCSARGSGDMFSSTLTNNASRSCSLLPCYICNKWSGTFARFNICNVELLWTMPCICQGAKANGLNFQINSFPIV